MASTFQELENKTISNNVESEQLLYFLSKMYVDMKDMKSEILEAFEDVRLKYEILNLN